HSPGRLPGSASPRGPSLPSPPSAIGPASARSKLQASSLQHPPRWRGASSSRSPCFRPPCSRPIPRRRLRLPRQHGHRRRRASQMWFLAFALESAAKVRTLAVVEILFAQVVSHNLFKQSLASREAAGIVLISVGVVLLLNL